MSNYTVLYRLNDEAQARILVETGEKPNWQQKIEIDMIELAPEQRATLLHASQGKLELDLSAQYVKLIGYRPSGDNRLRVHQWLYSDTVKFGSMMSNDQLITEITAYSTRLKELESQAQTKVDEAKIEIEAAEARRLELIAEAEVLFKQAKAISDDEEALRALRREMPEELAGFQMSYSHTISHVSGHFYRIFLMPFEEARKEAAAKAAEAERDAWIEAHGSEHLKLAHTGGYEITRLYVTERFNAEIGSPWTIDFYDKSQWNERSNPSLTELKAEEKASTELGDKVKSVKIVWLTNPPQSHPVANYDDWDYEPFDEAVALVARGYLGKYDLVKML